MPEAGPPGFLGNLSRGPVRIVSRSRGVTAADISRSSSARSDLNSRVWFFKYLEGYIRHIVQEVGDIREKLIYSAKGNKDILFPRKERDSADLRVARRLKKPYGHFPFLLPGFVGSASGLNLAEPQGAGG